MTCSMRADAVRMKRSAIFKGEETFRGLVMKERALTELLEVLHAACEVCGVQARKADDASGFLSLSLSWIR
jgi:hypothetical protein